MTLPSEPGLTPEELGELRHEMRTPFNAIIGYTEMLLEAGADEGRDDLLTSLRQLHADALDLLGIVNAALAPGMEVRCNELWNLGGAVYAHLEPLAGHVEALLEQGRRGGPESFLPDLGRIHTAVGILMHLTGDRLRAGTCILPPPVTAAPPAEVLADPRSPAFAPRCWGNVLVVDDVDLNRDLLCRRLEREGYQAQTAKGGGEALAMLASGHFDLVLLDILMPEIDGYEVLRRIKGSAALRDIPVLMISALDEMRSVVRCIEMGAEDYLPKPFDPTLLRARVGACLEKKRLRDKELEYLAGVAAVQAAAAAVEAGTFDAEGLAAVAARTDELGTLARVFQRMASEVRAREERLKSQLTQLRIEIDEARKQKHVEEITSGGFFQELRGRADKLRARMGKKD